MTFRTYACRFGYNLDNDTIKIYGVIKHPSYLYLCCCDYNYINNTVSNYKVTNITSVEIRKRYSYDCGISSMKIEPFPSACTLNKVIIVIKYSKSYSSDDDTGYAGIINMDNGTITALDDQNLWGADWQRNHFLTQIQWSPNGKYCTIGRVLRYAIILHFSNDYSSYSTVKSTVNLNLMGLAIMDDTKFIFENKVYTFSNPSTALYTLPFTIESYCICIGNKCFNKATDTTINIYDIEDDTFTLSKTINVLNQNLFITSGYVGKSSFTFNSSNYQLGSYHISDKGELIQLQAKGVTLYNTENAKNISTGNVLSGKKYYDMSGLHQGTMPNNGTLNYTPTMSQQTIPAGYTSGGTIKAINVDTLPDFIICYDLAKELYGYEVQPYVKDGLFVYYDSVSYTSTSGNILTDISGNGRNGTLSTTSGIIKEDNAIKINSGYITTGTISRSVGTWEIYCSVNTNFVPRSSTKWYECSCVYGCELSETKQDFGIVINKSGYYAIGYSTDSVAATTIKANDGLPHHLVLTYNAGTFKLYIDEVLAKTVSYTMSGTIPTNYGIFWNKDNANTSVQGKFYTMRHYTRVLTDSEIAQNYLHNQSRCGID